MPFSTFSLYACFDLALAFMLYALHRFCFPLCISLFRCGLAFLLINCFPPFFVLRFLRLSIIDFSSLSFSYPFSLSSQQTQSALSHRTLSAFLIFTITPRNTQTTEKRAKVLQTNKQTTNQRISFPILSYPTSPSYSLILCILIFIIYITHHFPYPPCHHILFVFVSWGSFIGFTRFLLFSLGRFFGKNR